MSVDVTVEAEAILPDKFLDEFRAALVGQLDEETLRQVVEELDKSLKATDTKESLLHLYGDNGLECGFIPNMDVLAPADTHELVAGIGQLPTGPRLLTGTKLNVSIRNGVLSGTTAGEKKFTGQNAKGFGRGIGYLDKSSSTIYTSTTSYELSPGNILDTIVFKNASSKKVGTWKGKFIPKVPKSSGPGRWNV